MKTSNNAAKTIPAFYTLREAAEVARVHVQTIKRYIDQGKLKAFQLDGKVLVVQGNLIDFITSRPYGKSVKGNRR